MGADIFNAMELDAIGEIMNISLGASATAISTMLGTRVNITTPEAKLLDREAFSFAALEPALGVDISYVKGLEGSNVMVFRRDDIRIIVGRLIGQEIPPEEFVLDELNTSAICEVMNQMMGSSATALADFLGYQIDISTPGAFEIKDEESFKERYFTEEGEMVIVSFALEIGDTLKSIFMNIMSKDLIRKMLVPFRDSIRAVSEPEEQLPPEAEAIQDTEALNSFEEESIYQEEPEQLRYYRDSSTAYSYADLSAQEEEEKVSTSAQRTTYGQGAVPVQGAPVYGGSPSADADILGIISKMQESQIKMMEMMSRMEQGSRREERGGNIIQPVNSARYENDSVSGEEEAENKELLMKLPLEISVEIGRTRKLVKDILELSQGSLVVLDKMAGERADVFVNGECIARGDIVIVEENFGIRITEIVSRNYNPESL